MKTVKFLRIFLVLIIYTKEKKNVSKLKTKRSPHTNNVFGELHTNLSFILSLSEKLLFVFCQILATITDMLSILTTITYKFVIIVCQCQSRI